MRYLIGIALGLLGGFVWSVGRSLKMVAPAKGQRRGCLPPSVITYIGWALICYGGLAIGGMYSAPACIVLFSLLSFVWQIWGFRVATGMSYEDWSARHPELAASFRSRKKVVSKPAPINLNEFRTGIQGQPYAELIRHHIRRQTTQHLHDGGLDTIGFLPSIVRPLVGSFIDAWNLRIYDREFWRTDCATVLDAIVEDARNRLIAAQAPTDDETLFNMFQIVTLNFAWSASDQPKFRKFIGI
jgi:hypothetical protein